MAHLEGEDKESRPILIRILVITYLVAGVKAVNAHTTTASPPAAEVSQRRKKFLHCHVPHWPMYFSTSS